MKNFTLTSKIADRALFSGDFVNPFPDPSQTLRISSGLWLRALAQGFGSGLRFRTASYSVILTLSEAKGKNLHRRPFGYASG